MFATVEYGASRLGKRPMTGMTDLAAFGVRVDTNPVACATIRPGAYYQLRAHRW
jgi:hypothetical protein